MPRFVFTALDMPGTNTSNGIFTAVLNRSDLIIETFFLIKSTLQIQHLNNLNESSLTCAGLEATVGRVDRMISITVSGE